jgi:hypothetical protein
MNVNLCFPKGPSCRCVPYWPVRPRFTAFTKILVGPFNVKHYVFVKMVGCEKGKNRKLPINAPNYWAKSIVSAASMRPQVVATMRHH